MINCQRVQQYMSDYIDDTLRTDLRQAFEDHLRDCSSCRQLSERVARTVHILGSLPEKTVSASFEYSLRQKLQAEKKRQTSTAWYRFPFPGVYRSRPAFAAMLGILIIGTGLLLFRGHLFQADRQSFVVDSGNDVRLERINPSGESAGTNSSAPSEDGTNELPHYVLSTLSPQSIEIRRDYRPQTSDSLSGELPEQSDFFQPETLDGPFLVRYVLPSTYHQVPASAETFNP